jgi:hypothetical protein
LQNYFTLLSALVYTTRVSLLFTVRHFGTRHATYGSPEPPSDTQYWGVEKMRKLTAALALLTLVLFVAAGRAAADTTSYKISGMYGAGSSTTLSNPGDTFLFSFKVDPSTLAGSPLASPSNIQITYTDITASISEALTGTITFEPSSAGGLLDIDFTFGGDTFLLLISSPTNQQLFTVNGGIISLPSTPPGGLAIKSDLGNCSASFLGDDVTGNCTPIDSGTVTAIATVPEPSSLLLLVSSLLVMAPFARRRFA